MIPTVSPAYTLSRSPFFGVISAFPAGVSPTVHSKGKLRKGKPGKWAKERGAKYSLVLVLGICHPRPTPKHFPLPLSQLILHSLTCQWAGH